MKIKVFMSVSFESIQKVFEKMLIYWVNIDEVKGTLSFDLIRIIDIFSIILIDKEILFELEFSDDSF